MNSPTTTSLHIAASALATLFVVFPAIWGGFALWYQLPGGQIGKALGVALWSALSVGVMIALSEGRIASGLVAFALLLGGLFIWWVRLTPTHDAVWTDDVARLTAGTVDGNRVILQNVRNFDWHSKSDYTQRWETRSFDLDGLRTVDMIMSYWRGAAIAHLLISFGFDGGAHLAFSVEVRRRKMQKFSEIGGFFKEFSLSIIAADERDVIRVRTNIRGEDAFLYRVQMPKAAMRSLLLSYVAEANGLVDVPRFYNTISVNCTTLVYHMVTRIVGHLPLDYRLLLTGYLPEYVYRVGGLDRRFSLEELRERGHITDRARQSDRREDFSADIRRGLPV